MRHPDVTTVTRATRIGGRWKITLSCGHSFRMDAERHEVHDGRVRLVPQAAPEDGTAVRCPERPIVVVHDEERP